MRIINAKEGIDVLIDNTATTIVIERPGKFSSLVTELYNQINGDDGEFILSENNSEISLEKTAEIVFSPIAINLNDRRFISKLYADLLTNSNQYEKEQLEINSQAINLMDGLISNCPYFSVEYDTDFDLSKLLKLYDVRICRENESLAAKVIEYIKLCSRLLKKKMLVFINIRSYLTSDELKEIVKMCEYHNIDIIFIENQEPNHCFFDEKRYIIDKDDCIISYMFTADSNQLSSERTDLRFESPVNNNVSQPMTDLVKPCSAFDSQCMRNKMKKKKYVGAHDDIVEIGFFRTYEKEIAKEKREKRAKAKNINTDK